MALCISLLCLSFLTLSTAQEVTVSFPPGTDNVMSGQDKQYDCIASSDSGVPQVVIEKKSPQSKEEITNATAPGRIFIIKEELGNNKVKLSIRFQPVLVGDQSFYDCSASFLSVKKTSQIDMFVLPATSIPKITMKGNFSSNSSIIVGEKVILNCDAASKFEVFRGASIFPKLELTWLFSSKNGTPGNKLSDGSEHKIATKDSKEGPDGNFTLTISSTLTMDSVRFDNYGYYTCNVKLRWQQHSDYSFKETQLLSIAGESIHGSTSREEKVKAGSNAVLLCDIDARPPTTSTWTKDGEALKYGDGSRYHRGNESNQIFNVLTISDVTYTDRGIYECHSTSQFADSRIQIRLRVRDPLGAVWPFIGIIIETIILVIIIAVYEQYKKSQKKKKRSETTDGISSMERKETSPLLPKSGEPGVAYSGDTGGVTLTAVANPNA